MKLFSCLLLVAVAQAAVFKTKADTRHLPAPSITQFTSFDGGFRVTWAPVQSYDVSDPVLGYKVKVWEQQTKNVINYEFIDGVYVMFEENDLLEFPEGNQIPDWEPTEILVEADKTTAQVYNIKMGLTYEARVQAYTKNIEGPISAQMRLLMGEAKVADDQKLDRIAARDLPYIPAPTLTGLIATNQPGFTVQWMPIVSNDASDPIVGYKVNVWEQKKKKVSRYEIVDGVIVVVEEYVLVEFTGEVPDWKPTEIIVPGASSTSAQVVNIEFGLGYEVRVQGYTNKGDGPLSKEMRIQFPKVA